VDSSTNVASPTDTNDALPRGWRVLQSGVTLSAGANTLNVDIPVASLTTSVTLGGQALPATNAYGLDTEIYLKAKDTGRCIRSRTGTTRARATRSTGRRSIRG